MNSTESRHGPAQGERTDPSPKPPQYGIVKRAIIHGIEPLTRWKTQSFLHRELGRATACKDRFDMLELSMRECRPEGLVLEFGVYQARSLNFIADLARQRTTPMVSGFDGFQGLPERWGFGFKKGAYNLGGRIPPVRDNVQLIKGNFEDTLEPFLRDHAGPAAFVHLDADLYSSTKFVLDTLARFDRITSGTVLQFDELMGYPMWWRRGEFQAFREFVRRRRIDFEFLSFVPPDGPQVTLRLL